MTQNKGKISTKTILFYSVGGLGITIPYLFFTQYAMYFYTDVFRLAPAAVGVMILLARIWDAVNDPMMGILVDKTKSKRGKCIPHMMYGNILLALTFILTFVVIDGSDTLKMTWATVTYVGFGMASTVVGTSYLALNPRISKCQQDTLRLNSGYTASNSIATILVALGGLPLITYFSQTTGNVPLAYTYVAVILTVVTLIALYITTFGVKEPSSIPQAGETSENAAPKVSILTMLKSVMANKPCLHLYLVSAIYCIIFACSSSFLLYYCMAVLKDPTMFTSIMVVSSVVTILINLFLPAFMAKTGFKRKRVICVALIISLAIIVFRYATRDRFTGTIIPMCAVFYGAMATFYSLYMPMLMDTIDYGEYKTGVRSDGLVIASTMFNAKLGAGVAAAIIGFVIEGSGYDPSLPEQTAKVVSAVTHGYFIPLVLSVVLILIAILTYKKTDKEMAEIKEKLRLRNHVEAQYE